MTRTKLNPGEHSEPTYTPLELSSEGRWVTTEETKRWDRIEAWRVRCTYRDHNGKRGEISLRIAGGRRRVEVTAEGERRITGRLTARLRGGADSVNAGDPFVAVGNAWLNGDYHRDRSERTLSEYRTSWKRCIVEDGHLSGLTLGEVNQAPTLRRTLQTVADTRGTGSAKMLRSVLSLILQHAVESEGGALPINAMRSVSSVTAKDGLSRQRRASDLPRNTEHGLSRIERDAVVAHADAKAVAVEDGRKDTAAKWAMVAGLVGFLAGTGVRIGEALSLQWEDVHLDVGWVQINGTKTLTSTRPLPLAPWLTERLEQMPGAGGQGYVFHSPSRGGDSRWEQSNAGGAVAEILRDAGFGWATPHVFRRTIATSLHKQGVPLLEVANQLGHKNPSMTLDKYLGREHEPNLGLADKI